MGSLVVSVGSITQFICVLVFLATWALCHQLLVHPLRNYPGPPIARFSNLYSAWFAIKRTLHLEIWKNHQKYGKSESLEAGTLALASPYIYRNDRVTKSPTYLVTQAKPGLHSVWNALDKNLHRRRRALVGRATADASMRDFEPAMLEQVDIFVQQLARSQHRPVDVRNHCSYLSFDIIGLLSFGYALNLQTEKENRRLTDNLARAQHRLNVFMQIPMVPRYRLQRFLNLPFTREREETAHLLETMVRSRMAKDTKAKRDLYSYVANEVNAEDDESIRFQDLWYEAFFFIIAGGDTSSTALSATFFYLSHNSRCYKRLAEEVRASFKSGSEIRGKRLSDLPYLRACIDEALRMSPPVPGTLWRCLPPEEEGTAPFVVDGHIISPGTKVGVNTYSLHHNEEYFPQPFTYDPDRWLIPADAGSGAEARKIMHDAFAAFSVGSRGCAGKSMAYMEVSLALAKTLWYFDFELATGGLGKIGLGQEGEFRLHDVFTSTHDGPYLIFRARPSLGKDLGDVEVMGRS
ncbi:cytochrome P450 [Xylariaceae sp. FL0804]|nr:cytochrome P450 [Xylariaceae sp. FL0804]